MNSRRIISFIFLFSLFLGSTAYSQSFLKKVQSKAEDEAIKKMFKDDKNKDNNKNSNTKSDSLGEYKGSGSGSGSGSGRSSVQNTGGGGVSNTPPDVLKSIKSAKSAYDAKNYVDARYAVRQAMLGVEIEIGQNILKSLPDKADGLPKDEKEDVVRSNGAGFQGLFIQRVYRTEKKELSVNIMNDAVMLSGINMMLSNPSYTSEDKNTKQVQFNEYKGLLQYDESSGYTLSVPFGQSSLYQVKGVNYKNEDEIMAAAKLFDLNKIKTELGEK